MNITQETFTDFFQSTSLNGHHDAKEIYMKFREAYNDDTQVQFLTGLFTKKELAHLVALANEQLSLNAMYLR